MTAETENPILRHLRAIRTDITALGADARSVQAEATVLRHELRALVVGRDRMQEGIADIKVHLGRIERRLDLDGEGSLA